MVSHTYKISHQLLAYNIATFIDRLRTMTRRSGQSILGCMNYTHKSNTHKEVCQGL